MKRYRVYLQIVRWEEWLVAADNTDDACIRVVERGEGRRVDTNDNPPREIGEGTYAYKEVEE